MKKIRFLILLFITFSLFSSCMTMADCDYTEIDTAINSSDYITASDFLDKNQNRYYSSKENVLLYLDQGIINHFLGEYEKSNEQLSLAETEIEQNFTKSISQKIGQNIINDNIVEYAGETYEDIYTNIFMCLNYIHLNKIDDAFVEIRRFDNKMKFVGVKYQTLIDEAKIQLKNDYNYYDSNQIDNKIKFHNSAFARYLSMLLYRTENDLNSAEIDYNKIIEAFDFQKSIYNFHIPDSLKDELNVPKNMARVNVISMVGRSPIKQEEVLRIPFDGAYYKLALPVLKCSDTKVSCIEIIFKDKSTNDEFECYLEMIESIENIMNDLFQHHYDAIYTRTLLRSIAKATGSLVLDAVSENSDDANVQLLFGFLNIISQITTEATERADVRSSRYFPELICIGGINLEPSIYDVTVNYYDKKLKLIYSHLIENLTVEKNKLNLIESVYQR